MAEEEKTSRSETSSIIQVIMDWSLGRKLSLIAAAVISIVLFSVIIMQSRVADYSLLFANLPNQDASGVIEWLKERKIPYRLEDGGRDIMIPADQVYEARIDLAGSGLANGGVGFEIFDQQSFGMTDFAQQVNYRRALQGELMRTITSLAPVEAARVHLALPEKRLFREQQQPTKASVIIKLVSGRSLNESQLQGIVHLVSGSVEGLDAEHVTVVDSSGKALSSSRANQPEGPLSAGKLSFQQAMEQRLETRAQSLLDRALGAGNSLVRVTTEIDFDEHERVEEALDPKGAVVVSEQTSSEEGSGESVGGVPGVVSNLQEGAAPQTTTRTPSKREEETINYELSKVVSKTVQSVGDLKSLSVSVLVADRRAPGVDGGESTVTPRSEEEIQEIEKMVRTALGIDQQRGDRITVVSMPFESGFNDLEPIQPSLVDQVYTFMPLIKYSLLAVAALLAYLLFLRPLMRTLRGAAAETQPMKTVEELETELRRDQGETPLLGGAGDPLAQIRQEVLGGDMLPVQVVKSWLKEAPAES